MKICHVCKAECEDFAELCSVCGADLADVVEEEVIEETDEILLKDPVLLVSVEDVVSAEIFKDILKENNIVFTCEEKDNGGAMQVLFGGGFVACNIYVESADYDVADKLYAEFLENEPDFDEEFYIEEDTQEEFEG